MSSNSVETYIKTAYQNFLRITYFNGALDSDTTPKTQNLPAQTHVFSITKTGSVTYTFHNSDGTTYQPRIFYNSANTPVLLSGVSLSSIATYYDSDAENYSEVYFKWTPTYEPINSG